MTTEQASQLSAIYNKFINDTGKTTLWTNPSPTSGFAAQTITVSDLSKYTYIIIELKATASSAEYTHRAFQYPMDSSENISAVGGSSSVNGLVWRNISMTSTSITFTAGYYKTTGDSTFLSGTNYAIPTHIYGI